MKKLLAPNGKPSNLNEKQYKLVRTPAFKKWFGDSKVVDANGDPLVVYHGTDQDFSVFRTKNGLIVSGSYFANDVETAN